MVICFSSVKHKFNLNCLAVTIRPPLELDVEREFVKFCKFGIRSFTRFNKFWGRKTYKMGFIHEGQVIMVG